jgi:cysteine desulfurase / selenocysteine lyase
MTDERLGTFGDFSGRAWLNTAHQGALPMAAAAEAYEAVAWKTTPSALTQARFDEVPAQLRAALGRLVGVPADDIVLANSASYGLHLVANAYPWCEGDEVLVMAGDFPSDILPWLLLEKRHGVKVVRLRPRERVVSPDELEAAITARTKVFCTTWVHSFSGYAVDLDQLGAICRSRGVTFVVNASQALGTRPIDLARSQVDALTCVGFKWLCGPYGTGFCWLRPELRDRLRPQKAYWLAMQAADDLGKEVGDTELRDGLGARAFDVFGTANFFNFKPWTAAIEHLLAIGLERIAAHNDALVSHFIDRLDDEAYELLSPRKTGVQRSTLVFFSHHDRARNRRIHASLTEAGVDIAFRGGALRLSPHLYNGPDDIDRAVAILRGHVPPSSDNRVEE